MKKLVIVLVLFSMTLNSFAQKKKAKHKFQVEGVCEMRKERIEKACLDTKVVKMATWNVESHQLVVILTEKKTTVKKLKENIAKVGHDTDDAKATDEVYAKMHECCKYRELENH
ncbi:MAG: hypothetical protein V3U80_07435 [Flavobacteriaceae bacterium]